MEFDYPDEVINMPNVLIGARHVEAKVIVDGVEIKLYEKVEHLGKSVLITLNRQYKYILATGFLSE